MKRYAIIIGLIFFVIFSITSSSADLIPKPDKQSLKKDEVWVCDNWQLVGNPIEKQTVCLSWVKKDCSNRMYKEICKLGNQP